MKTHRVAPIAAAFALALAPALLAEEFRPIFHPPTFTIRNTQITTSFRGLDGKTQPPGLYDLEVSQSAQGILIGLLKNGKRVGETKGTFVPPPSGKAGMADGSVKPGGATKMDDWEARARAGMQDIHFDTSSKLSFGSGGGEGKISCSNNLHPGGANQGSISFLLPAVQALRK